jgi:hypothetical protein
MKRLGKRGKNLRHDQDLPLLESSKYLHYPNITFFFPKNFPDPLTNKESFIHPRPRNLRATPATKNPIALISQEERLQNVHKNNNKPLLPAIIPTQQTQHLALHISAHM